MELEPGMSTVRMESSRSQFRGILAHLPTLVVDLRWHCKGSKCIAGNFQGFATGVADHLILPF